MPLMSFVLYARHRGCSKQAVSLAVKQGRISTVVDEKGFRRIDSDVADREWALKTNDSRRPLSERVENARKKGTPMGGKGTTSRTVQEYADARAEREGYQARLVRIELGKKSGELVSAKAVEDAAFKMGRTIRDNLFNIPDRVSHQLAAETDPLKIHEILRVEIHKVLEMLASPDLSDNGGGDDDTDDDVENPGDDVDNSAEIGSKPAGENHANP